MHVVILPSWALKAVGLKDLTFNQELAEAVTWIFLRQDRVHIMGKLLD